MDSIKKYRKLPMMAVVFSIITMMILAYNAIFGFDGVNPIDNSRLAQLLENKETIETEIKNYTSNIEVKDFTVTSIEDVLILNDKYSVVYDKDGINVYVNAKNKKLYKVDVKKYENLISSNSLSSDETLEDSYYIDEDGSIFLIFEDYSNLPRWLKNILENGKELEKNYIMTFISTKN